MIILVLGGARSGKSEVGERLASALAEPVTFVATGMAADQEMAARIAAHRARRPPGWATLEVGPGEDLALVLERLSGTALVDSLGTWLAGTAGWAAGAGSGLGDGRGEEGLGGAAGRSLGDALASRGGDTVVVSDEVGLGVHPSSPAGRSYREALGRLNQQVASAADRVLLVVAGQVMRLHRPGELAEVAGLAGPGRVHQRGD